MSFVKELMYALAGKNAKAAELGGSLVPGGGYAANMPLLNPYRGTSRQVCGLYPFIVGSSAPMVGVPLGKAIDGSGAVCADPISWFERGLISAPSAMVLGLNGLGKSSLIRRMIVALEGYGVHALVLGDIKPDYVDAVRALGGQVIDGAAGINPLDAGNVADAISLMEGRPHEQKELLESAHERKKSLVCSLIHIIRRRPPEDREETIIDEAIRILEETADNPVLADLLKVIQDAPERLRGLASIRGDLERYQELTDPLEGSLMALLSGRFGSVFAQPTTTPMRMDRSVVFDVHGLLNAEQDLQAAVLMACWSYGFATVEIAQTLADLGLAPRRRYVTWQDEVWRVLRASSGLVDRIDAVTRLNRTIGVGQVMITHSMSDLSALSTHEDRVKALGFVERSKMLFLGGLPAREMEMLEGVVSLSEAEKDLLKSWKAPGTVDQMTGQRAAPAGLGKFLLKTSDAPGTPFQVQFTAEEYALSDTNKRWEMKSER